MRTHRVRLGFTQQQLAEIAGLSQARVSDTETGRKVSSDGVLVAIANALELPAEDAAALRAAGKRSREAAANEARNKARSREAQVFAAILKTLADGLQDAATRLEAA